MKMLGSWTTLNEFQNNMSQSHCLTCSGMRSNTTDATLELLKVTLSTAFEGDLYISSKDGEWWSPRLSNTSSWRGEVSWWGRRIHPSCYPGDITVLGCIGDLATAVADKDKVLRAQRTRATTHLTTDRRSEDVCTQNFRRAICGLFLFG